MSQLTKSVWIACIGYPNAGKTSVFNTLTKSHFKAVNYPGSTVQYNLATTITSSGDTIHWIDTPGVVTFSPGSDDERVTHDVLTNLSSIDPTAPPYPNLIVYVADAFQLERHLMGLKLLQSQGYPVTLIVTRADLMKKYGGHVAIDRLSDLAQCDVFYVSSHNGIGLPSIDTLYRLVPTPPYKPLLFESESGWKSSANWASMTVRKVLTPPIAKNEFDRWILHPKFGGVLFAFIMGLFFFLIFLGAQPLMDGIDTFWQWGITALHHWAGTGKWKNLIIDGIIANIGSVLVFTPQILLLFLATGILESTGYLARAAIIVDRPLSWLGLTGKSFVPLLSGSACAIPAILATRTLPNRAQRLITLWMIPLMPCSARIPVYGLLLALLFRGHPLRSAIGMVVIYGISITLAAILGNLISAFYKTPNDSFYIELPRWQMPYWPMIIKNGIRQTIEFLKKAGPAILAISILVWGLSQYPSADQSWLAHIGKWIAPLFAPMGWDWRVGVAVLASFAAREVFVAVLASMLLIGEDQLGMHLMSGSTPLLTTPSILGLIVFFMISMQCGSTLAVIKKETGRWTIPAIMTIAYVGLAYVASIAVVHIALLF